jgi:predicted HAD superfamily phosphohydrolase YqeG
MDDKGDRIKFQNVSLEIELDVEKKYIYTDAEFIKILEQQYKKGKKIFIVSDFYAGREYISELLKCLKIQYLFSDIFVSADYNARKSSGTLYSLLISKLNINADNLIMIGDNLNSDVKVPISIGINAYYKPNTLQVSKEGPINKKIDRIIFNKNSNYIFAYFIPELLFFISSLFNNLIKDNIKDVLFCSREGETLKILFDKYQKTLYGDEQIKTHILYVSRRATYLPALDEFSNENFDLIFNQYSSISLSDFLFSIGFESNEIEELLSKCKYDGNTLLTERNCDILDQLGKLTYFINLYNEKRFTAKEYLTNYLKSFNLEKYCIVDVGWKGTIQNNIQAVLKNAKECYGYYIGLVSSNHYNEFKKGLLFSDLPSESFCFEIFNKNKFIYEKVLMANHGAVSKYDIDSEGKVIPIFLKNENETKSFEINLKYQSVLFDKYNLILDLLKNNIDNPFNNIRYVAKSSLKRQCIFQSINWKSIDQVLNVDVENFGNISKNKRVHNNIKNFKRAKLMYSPYVYMVLSKYHLSIFRPLAAIYCKLAYFINVLKYRTF